MRDKQGYRGGIHFCLRRYTLFQEIKDIIKAYIEKEENMRDEVGKRNMRRFRNGIHAINMRRMWMVKKENDVG